MPAELPICARSQPPQPLVGTLGAHVKCDANLGPGGPFGPHSRGSTLALTSASATRSVRVSVQRNDLVDVTSINLGR